LNFVDKKAILFDLDGTLIDSVPDLASAVNYMLEELGRDTFIEDTIRHWVGNGAQILVKRALSGDSEIDDTIDEELFSRAMDIFLGYYSKNLSIGTTPYAGVPETLKKLDRNGYRLAIVTNKPFGFIRPILEGLELEDLFEIYIGGDSLDRKKPDPLPLLHICERLGLSIDECVMVGDSRNDIVAANESGMQSIGVTYGYNYGEDISIYGPDIVVDNFADIHEYFSACFPQTEEGSDREWK